MKRTSGQVIANTAIEGYLKTHPDEAGFLNMFNRDVQRMKDFTGWTDEQVQSITVPTLVINSSKDVGSPGHTVAMYRLFPSSELVIFPGGHGAFPGAIETRDEGHWSSIHATSLIEEFLG